VLELLSTDSRQSEWPTVPLVPSPGESTPHRNSDASTPAGAAGGRLVSRQEIIDTALVIAERVGVAGVTMRLLADELGVSVATAYYHVKDKAELLRLMGDATLADVPCPPRDAPWDRRLLALSEDVRRTTARYRGLFPGAPGITEGPEVARLSECTLEMLRDAGVPEGELEAALGAVATYIWGRLLLDSLGQDALSRGSRRSSRRAVDTEPSAPTFEASFEFLLDGIRHRGRRRPPTAPSETSCP
jgi:AcrR family transcriptional regulator